LQSGNRVCGLQETWRLTQFAGAMIHYFQLCFTTARR
jgi:hypothetical protein